VEVGEDDAGERVDALLAGRLDLSRTRIQKLLEAGEITVASAPGCAPRVPRKSEAAEPGWRVEVRVPPPEATALVAEDLPLPIVYEDEHLAVVDKPAGMVVHPAPGHRRGTMVNALLHHLDGLSGVGGRLRPGIVHRLDKDTSGLLVVAKDDPTHQALSDALRRRRVKRLYTAATWGHLEFGDDTLTIDAPLARDPADRKRMAVVEGGRRAVTRARLRERWPAAELLAVALQTGRTHQIRVHLAHLGHPVVGDELYGAGWERGMSGPARPWARELARRVARQFLHAAELAFDHPATGERMRLRSPLPPDLAAAARWARGEAG
jgi:23S rRNA pseudouridine1911/1915/1917 synthase